MDKIWFYNTFEIFASPLIIIVGGIFFGFGFKRYIHSKLKLAAKKSTWTGDDAVLDAIEPHIVVWFFLGALSIATSTIDSVAMENLYLKSFLKL